LDSDPGIGFEVASYSIWENAGAIIVTVLRGNGLALGPISADYATGDLTAKAGQDYQAVSGTLAFEQNETVKTITIPILRNGLVKNNTSFRVILSNPTGGAALGRTSTSVIIMNAPELGTFRAVAPPFDTALTIGREGGLNILTWSGGGQLRPAPPDPADSPWSVGGQLQRADRPTGPWQTLTNASSPYAVQSALPTSFYRVTRPRPVNLYVPSSYDGQTPLPLVILLHSYHANGDWEESFWHIRPLAEARGFLYCHPDSALDQTGAAFWNATDAGFDLFNTGIDDAGYLRSLIEEIGQQFAVDRKRISLIGNSGGAFMAHRMACQFADLIAGIASRAGATFLDPSRCEHSQPVNILQIHGTQDVTVSYDGGANAALIMPAFPGALKTIELWAGYNGASDPVTEPGFDLTVPRLDTVVTRYMNHPPGGAVELWKIIGGTHFDPPFSPEFAPRVIDWLLAHPKP
jgi:polyhydroxybutyrate depolymerase